MGIHFLYLLVVALVVPATPSNHNEFDPAVAFPQPGTCSLHMVVHETCEKTKSKKVTWVNKRYGNISALIDGVGVRYDPGPSHENFLLNGDRHYFNYGNAKWDRHLGVWADMTDNIFFMKLGGRACYWLHTGSNDCGRCGVGDWTAGQFQCWQEKKDMYRVSSSHVVFARAN
jgi:hypothetical protein